MPVRTCVACRRRLAQDALVRFARRPDGWAFDTGRRRAAGRGAYLCSDACAGRVGKNKRFPGLAAAAAAYPWSAAPLSQVACRTV